MFSGKRNHCNKENVAETSDMVDHNKAPTEVVDTKGRQKNPIDLVM
jgi:hypothetical protein